MRIPVTQTLIGDFRSGWDAECDDQYIRNGLTAAVGRHAARLRQHEVFGPVANYHACREGDQCAHCAAGRPAAPAVAGHPFDDYQVCSETEEAARLALPPAFHRPVFDDMGQPNGWLCAACWYDDGAVLGWPCKVAQKHGSYVFRAMKLVAGE